MTIVRHLFAICGLLSLGACTKHLVASGGIDDLGPTPDLAYIMGSINFDPGTLVACASAKEETLRVPLYMLVVLDGSGSMADDNKWTAVTAALDSIFDSAQTLADPGFAVGLTIFADNNDATIGPTTAGPYNMFDVPLAFVDSVQHDNLRMRLDSTGPNLGTPTYEVLSGQYPLLEAYVPKSPIMTGGKTVMVFMTDGVPDPDMPAGVNEQPWSLMLTQQEEARTPPIGTFVVGIGNLTPLDPAEYDPVFVGHMAKNGGFAQSMCNPDEIMDESKMCHFQITPGGKTVSQLTMEFENALDAIRTQALPCEYTLTIMPGVVLDPNSVNVLFTPSSGMPVGISEDPTNGWTYDNSANPMKVILHGSSCDTVRADLKGKIEIVLGCKTLIP